MCEQSSRLLVAHSRILLLPPSQDFSIHLQYGSPERTMTMSPARQDISYINKKMMSVGLSVIFLCYGNYVSLVLETRKDDDLLLDCAFLQNMAGIVICDIKHKAPNRSNCMPADFLPRPSHCKSLLKRPSTTTNMITASQTSSSTILLKCRRYRKLMPIAIFMSIRCTGTCIVIDELVVFVADTAKHID